MDEATAWRTAGEAMVARRDAVRREQVGFLVSVLEFVDAYPSPEPLPGPASERVVPAGGAGAGSVGEFVVLEVAARLGLSRPAAWSLVHDAVNLRSRHPRLWAALAGLQVEDWQARQVARSCAELGESAALWVDEQLDGVWGVVPWARVMRRLEGLIVRADRELAARKAEGARRNRFVSFRHLGDGTSGMAAQLDTGAALHLESVLEAIVDQLIHEGAQGHRGLLRARALEMLATPQNPDQAGVGVPGSQLPLADVVVHVAAEDLDPQTTGTGVARVTSRGGDVGPVLLEQISHLLGHRRVRVIPVIDLAGDPSTDSYEIPDQIRRRLLLREEYSVFPYSTCRSRSADLDHTVAFRRAAPGSPAPPGQTRISNLGHLGRSEHRAKTAGAWHLDQPAPGLYLWTDRLGRRWAVVGGHTHRLPDTEPPGTTGGQTGRDVAASGAVTPIGALPVEVRAAWQPRIDVIVA